MGSKVRHGHLKSSRRTCKLFVLKWIFSKKIYISNFRPQTVKIVIVDKWMMNICTNLKYIHIVKNIPDGVVPPLSRLSCYSILYFILKILKSLKSLSPSESNFVLGISFILLPDILQVISNLLRYSSFALPTCS